MWLQITQRTLTRIPRINNKFHGTVSFARDASVCMAESGDLMLCVCKCDAFHFPHGHFRSLTTFACLPRI